MVRRMMFRNERLLFRRKDDATGQEIFSEIPPQVSAKIYNKDYWWSDAWDPMSYGRDYDFSRPFFEQFRELFYTVPWPSRNISTAVHSDYCNNAIDLKNCYLCFNLGHAEDSAYLVDVVNQKNCFDVSSTTNAELCYDGMAVRDCYKTFFSITCEKCADVWLSRDCTGCSNCFGCANLRNKQYYIFNQPYTPEGYAAELGRILQGGSHKALEAAKQRAYEIWQSYPRKYMLSWHNTNVTGEWIALSKNAKYCFNATELENVAYGQNTVLGIQDAYDASTCGEKCELLYETEDIWMGCRNVKFSFNSWPAIQDAEYCAKCPSSSNLFGCVGLRNKSYCIFNKQYTREEYFALREKIIAHMNALPYTDAMGHIYRYGEFFPPEFSPFKYNETLAHDLFPLAKEEAIARGYGWRDAETRAYTVTMRAEDLPDKIGDTADSIIKEIIVCASCGKAYRIIQMELEFLRTMGIPLPRRCHDCRHMARNRLRNAPRFYTRTCQCAGVGNTGNTYQNQAQHAHGDTPCGAAFETSYASDRKEIIYCESCYNAEVA